MPHVTSMAKLLPLLMPCTLRGSKGQRSVPLRWGFFASGDTFCISPLQDPPVQYACPAHEIQTYITLTMDRMFSSGASESL